jgi:hypothetical protein
VNWTRILYQALYKCGLNLGGTAPSSMSPFFFHYYDHFNALTDQEKQVYRLAFASVREQLVQSTPLCPNTPETVPIDQSGTPLQPVNPNRPVGANGPQRQARTRDAGEGSSQPEGSRQSLPEHRPHSPATRAHPNGSSASRRDSMDSDEEDGTDEEYMPSVWSSARGKKHKSWSLSPEHSSKVPGNGPGSPTFGQVYQVKAPGGPSEPGPSTFLYSKRAPGGSSTPIPTPTS